MGNLRVLCGGQPDALVTCPPKPGPGGMLETRLFGRAGQGAAMAVTAVGEGARPGGMRWRVRRHDVHISATR